MTTSEKLSWFDLDIYEIEHALSDRSFKVQIILKSVNSKRHLLVPLSLWLGGGIVVTAACRCPRSLSKGRRVPVQVRSQTPRFQSSHFVEPCRRRWHGAIPRRPFTRSHPSGGPCVGSRFLILGGCRAARDGELQSGMRLLYPETSNFGWLLYRLSIFLPVLLPFVRYIDVDFKKRGCFA
jgi:hypothetical protein